MSTPDLKHLFVPGDGNVPPYLAGRKEEQATFQDCVDVLKNKRPAPQNLIVYGPRGNGKTALLRHLQTKTRQKEGSSPGVLWATPKELANPGKLVDLIIGDYSTLRSKIQSAGFSFNFGIVTADTQIDLSRRTLTLGDLLQARCQHQPLILMIDEAHRLGPQMGEELLNASQSVRNAGNPFLLVLAGTPNLEAALGKANASFWDRSELLPLGRLSPQEAGEALTIPFQEAGITFAPGVIESVVAQTHCYPFFIQVWGSCIAQQLQQAGERMISLETVKAAEKEVIRKRDAMYRVRFNELDRMKLLSVAKSIADTFSRSGLPVVHRDTLKEAIEKGLANEEPITHARVMENIEQLSHLGYVWPVDAYDYEPGIPSLMTFVQGASRSRTREKEAEPRTALSAAEQVEQWRNRPVTKKEYGIEL